MSFLAPWALWVAGGVSAAVIALHILASKNPKVTALPTARFIPDVPLRATARALRLSDVLLLLLRVAAVMLVGVAVARPELTRARRAVGRVVMVDTSHVAERKGAEDSARVYYDKGDARLDFDGSLSAGLAKGMRAASALRGEADSVEIVIISTFADEAFDSATGAIRAAWPGRVRVVRSTASGRTSESVLNEVRGSMPDDPLRATIALASRTDTGQVRVDSVRIDRGTPASADTTWTQHGLTLVRWPASLDSSGYPARAHIDTAGAVMSGEGAKRAIVVSSFVRTVDPPAGRVVARWVDGAPAATERTVMNGCVRDIAIPLPRSGDLVLRESTRRLVAALGAPCGFRGAQQYASDSTLAKLAGGGPLVGTRALEANSAPPGHLATWLLLAALALLLIEPLLRRQRAAA